MSADDRFKRAFCRIKTGHTLRPQGTYARCNCGNYGTCRRGDYFRLNAGRTTYRTLVAEGVEVAHFYSWRPFSMRAVEW